MISWSLHCVSSVKRSDLGWFLIGADNPDGIVRFFVDSVPFFQVLGGGNEFNNCGADVPICTMALHPLFHVELSLLESSLVDHPLLTFALQKGGGGMLGTKKPSTRLSRGLSDLTRTTR